MELLSEQALYELTNDLSTTFFHKSFKHEVRFNHRLRTTGGRYLPAVKTIELNPKYFFEFGQSEFIGIIKHELCHYHLHIEGKGYKHGDNDFKQLLKLTNSPRHCSPLPSQKETHHYVYRCTECSLEYKRKRRVNVKKYRCGRCMGELRKVSL